MFSVVSDYQDSIQGIAIVPIKGFYISKKYVIGDVNIYPKGEIDTEEIRGCKIDITFERIKDIFYDATIITFPIKYTPKNIMGIFSPSEKHKLIKQVLDKAEDVMNIFRYINSNFDKISNLPQRAGYIDGMISGFLVYDTRLKKSDYIWEKYYSSNISIGNGLNLKEADVRGIEKYFLPLINTEEVASIIRQAFRMYSDIIYMPTATNKFMQAMSLLEYLANPFEYENMQKAKAKIVPFSSDYKKRYFDLCERFKYLTSLKDENDKQIGLRTSIIHNGKTLEQLIDKGYEIDLLLRELQRYICNFINAIIEDSNQKWEYVEKKIEEKRIQVHAIKEGYEGKFEADTIIVIDFKFLNKAIEEVYQWYPQYLDRKFDICKFLMLVLEQSDIERKEYQIPVQIFYKDDEKVYNAIPELHMSQYEGLGFQSPWGEISIYTFKTQDEHDRLMGEFLTGYAREMNYFINPGAMYTNIVFISDRNRLQDDIFIDYEMSCKKIILGRLDNKRTTCFDECTWFDVQILIMTTLGIELYEECNGDFIFKIEEGRYQEE